jgi:hypothetical protein
LAWSVVLAIANARTPDEIKSLSSNFGKKAAIATKGKVRVAMSRRFREGTPHGAPK